MSPPGPTFSTIPPPAKRHQSGPPGQLDGIPPQQQGSLPPPPPPPSAPSYSFYQSNPKPYTVPYHSGPSYSTVPPPALASTQPGHPPPSTAQQERSPYSINGRPSPPAPRHSHGNPLPTNNTPPAATPSRQISSTYDTRPPLATSGFASINAPTTSGFAAINPRTAATPPAAYSSMVKSADTEAHRTPSATYQDHTFTSNSSSYAYNNGTPASNTAGSTPGTGKRTPSTTHPYQMSEAFANRHHHCERVDGLNRGIWTSYGPGGTHDRPNGPPVEMYLRCNHDDCRRIDWRTVHGLQCHIVKNHEQPKGTIGSLEKALDRYGVPIREVEEHEREHGEGTGGTMADPKNLKIKNKTKEAYRRSTPGSYGIDPTARPAGYKPSSPAVRDSPTAPSSTTPRSSSGSIVRRKHFQEESIYSDTDESGSGHGEHRKLGHKPSKKFEPARNDSHSTSVYMTGPPPATVDPNRQLQGDAVMKDVPSMPVWKQWSPSNHSLDTVPPPLPVSRPAPVLLTPKQDVPQSSPTKVTPAVVAPAQSPARSNFHSAFVEQKLKEEEKHKKVEKPSQILPAAESQDPDTKMVDLSEVKSSVETSQDAKDVVGAKGKVDGQPSELTAPAESATPDGKGFEAATAPTEVNGDGRTGNLVHDNSAIQDPPPAPEAPPAKSTRSALQSPTVNNKPLPPPTSAKRISRRSSTARKLSGDSMDGQTDMSTNRADGVDKDDRQLDGSSSVKGQEEDVDEDSITVAVDTGSPSKSRKEKDVIGRDGLTAAEREAKTPPKRNASGRFTRRNRFA